MMLPWWVWVAVAAEWILLYVVVVYPSLPRGDLEHDAELKK